MPNLVAVGLMVYDKDFQRIQKILSYVAMATRSFEGTEFVQ